KNTFNEKKITLFHNKENELGETQSTKIIMIETKERRIIIEKIVKNEQKNQLAVKDWLPLQRSQLQNIQLKQREGDKAEQENDSRGKKKTEESLVELIKRNNDLGIRIAWHNINRLKSNGLKLEALSDWANSE
ncbi:18384_t:CDS:2, partial [Gigaspora margarita]